jgi:hypothetical protein
MTPQRFKATIIASGSRTLVPLPFDPNEVWGAKQRHYVTGSVNGCAIRGLLDSNGTEFYLPLGAAWRRDNGLEPGAEAEVILLPEGPQGDRLSPDVAAALDSEPEAKAFFESLATFYRKNFVRDIESAKRPETRARRIAEMVALLKAGRRQ